VSWHNQVPFLAGRGYLVWAVNQRGYGGTSRPQRRKDYALDQLTGDIAGLVDASGAASVTLIGHDWGALVAWTFAIRRIRPLARLVIVNVPHPLCFRRELKTWSQRRKSWYVGFFQLPMLPELLLSAGGGACLSKCCGMERAQGTRFRTRCSKSIAPMSARPAQRPRC
jgi:Predicted hydrolases or acyltransferases (alpha/beta hydrolase superfamily)